MVDEKGVWKTAVAPDGRELVQIGTPEFPVELFGAPDGSVGVQEIPWHWHEEMEINIALGDNEIMRAEGKSFQPKAGQGMFIGGGVLHGAESAVPGKYFDHYSLVFHSSVIGGAPGSVFWQKYLAPLLSAPEGRCVLLTGESEWERQIVTHVEHIVRVWQTKRDGYEFVVREELSQIILLLVNNCLQDAPAPSERELRDAERIKKMMDFVRFHADEAITTEQIARSAAVSVSECLRCFHRMLGLTPKEYLRQHRVRHAATLLEQTDKSVSQIGEECGFEDMSYFARVFRAAKGCTPTEYRERQSKSR